MTLSHSHPTSPESDVSTTLGSSSTRDRQATPTLSPGLADVVLSTTRLSRVDGRRGELTLSGFAVEELAPNATFEQAIWLLATDHLPDAEQAEALHLALAARRDLPPMTLEVLRAAAERGLAPMMALRAAAATLELAAPLRVADGIPFSDVELSLLARLPRVVATFDRLRRGLEPTTPAPGLTLAADLLAALTGATPSPAAVRALDTYLVTVCDHGANASTFTARVIVSTGADLISAVVGALGALSGPLHGGAPGPALDMVKEIGSPERAEAFLRAKLEAGERLMGFGHRVYKVRDPRAAVLSAAAELLYDDPESGADRRLYELARHVEQTAIRLLDEWKPGRRLHTNVEFYTALLLDGIGLPGDLFTPLFGVARTAGWLAHCREQTADGKLIRPRLHYRGAELRRWPVDG